ncbi:MAG TPA: hypothetical protein VNO79_10695 [Actinomycetota bacterium]|nr:hypothetical protein [Actinomycetota bacterium]
MPDDLVQGLWSDRAAVYGSALRDMDEIVGVYLGQLPDTFRDFFHEEMHPHVINMIRLSWDDLASLAGKVFPVFVRPDNDTPTAKERAERLEKIAYGYNDAGRIVGAIDAGLLSKVLAWWMVGVAEAVAMVLPDYERKTPFFTFRDPRTWYPPVGWSPYTQADTDDALFAYQLTIGELKRRYPERADEIDRVLARSYVTRAGFTGQADSSLVWVGEYYSEETWIVQTLTDRIVTLVRSDQGDRGHPGVQPVVGMRLYSPAVRGRSIYSDQVSIQAAMARMFSQKLDYYDRTLYPMIFTTPLASKTIRVGPWAINEWDPTFQGQFRVDVVAPRNAIDADQTMAFVMGLSRILNRNPESFQGQAPSGRAESAKALASLRDSVVNITIREMLWPPMIHAWPKLYTKAAQLDLALWPDERKRASGRRRNQAFSMLYRPRVDLAGREEDFEVEPGVGLAGYQGTLEILQLVGAELLPEDDALEMLDHVRDAQEAKRKIQADRLAKLSWADLQAKAAEGRLLPGALAKLRRMVQAEGMDLLDAIEKLEEAGQLYLEPQPAALPGAAPGPPGAPPLPIPPLEVIRGGRA